MRLPYWIAVLALAGVLASFAASNREAVTLALWPFNLGLELPLYLAILAALCLGLVIGVLLAWTAGSRGRRESRRRARRVTALERELAGARPQMQSGEMSSTLAPRG